jgi:hypothetical protein
MSVLPPWKLAEREAWTETHPWLAGCYFGVLMGLFYVAWVVIFAGAEMLYVAVLGGLVGR